MPSSSANFDLGQSPILLDEAEDVFTFEDKRLDTKNLGKDVGEYIEENTSTETRKCTGKSVRLFNGVMRSYHEKAGSSFTELKEISVENLPGELAKFLMVVRKQDGSCYNASSLNTYYQSLARFIASEQYNSPLDIKTDVRFKKVREVLKLKCTESAMDGARPGINASKAVTAETVELAYGKNTLGRANPRALISTVHQACVIGFGCRANKETYAIQNKDIIYGPVGKTGYPEFLELSERITKTRRGGAHDIRDVEGKVYLDPENEDVCFVRTIITYQGKKTHINFLF